MPFDRRAALFSLLLEPAAEPTPEGCWRVHHVLVEAGSDCRIARPTRSTRRSTCLRSGWVLTTGPPGG